MKYFQFCCLFLLLWVPRLSAQPMVEIHHLDIGAGDATLIKINNRNPARAILIDAGGKAAGAKTIAYLQDINKGNLSMTPYLDFILTSHYHEDHFGGLVGYKTAAIGNICATYGGVLSPNSGITYNAVLDKGTSSPTATSLTYQQYSGLATRRRSVGLPAGTAQTVTSYATNGQDTVTQPLCLGGTIELGMDNNQVPIRLRLVAANGYVLSPTQQDPYASTDLAQTFQVNRNAAGPYENANNWGLVWLLEYGKFRYFTGGDIGGKYTDKYIDIESTLAENLCKYPNPYPIYGGHCCALKASHHGSDHSSNQAFIDTLKASTCVFSCGNRYGHPRQATLNRYEGAQWQVASLVHPRIHKYFLTELQFPRNMNVRLGRTSGNAKFVVRAGRAPAAKWGATSKLMPPKVVPKRANKGTMYVLRRAPRQPGNVIIKVYENDGTASIAQRSSFRTSYVNETTGRWITTPFIHCHN